MLENTPATEHHFLLLNQLGFLYPVRDTCFARMTYSPSEPRSKVGKTDGWFPEFLLSARSSTAEASLLLPPHLFSNYSLRVGSLWKLHSKRIAFSEVLV